MQSSVPCPQSGRCIIGFISSPDQVELKSFSLFPCSLQFLLSLLLSTGGTEQREESSRCVLPGSRVTNRRETCRVFGQAVVADCLTEELIPLGSEQERGSVNFKVVKWQLPQLCSEVAAWQATHGWAWIRGHGSFKCASIEGGEKKPCPQLFKTQAKKEFEW